MRKRRSSSLTAMALEVLGTSDKFSTQLFAQEIGSTPEKARKALNHQALKGRVEKLPCDCWIGKRQETTTDNNSIKEQAELITKAFKAIENIMEENRWLRAEVEKWATVARQAKIYHNGRENDDA